MRRASRDRKLLLLAPDIGSVPGSFSNPNCDPPEHGRMLAQAQTLRGRIYVEDGAIEQNELAPDGRHYIASDEESWHILTLDNAGTVCGCARYLTHESTISFTRLGLRHSPLAKCDQW